MNFVAIDVETANHDMASICQIGMVKYTDGKLADEWESYINPEVCFESIIKRVHGISEETVASSPTLPDVLPEIVEFIGDFVLVCHTHFDRVSLCKAVDRYQKIMPPNLWLDSAKVTRRTWEQFSYRGYGLENVCNFLEYDYQAHDALEDAKAAAQVLLAAEVTG
ncbi:MAG: 3'-5' exonuclease [Pirellulaceae bacterium]|nr:3'-5' exonuclease [Pirellulaceae bacterium]